MAIPENLDYELRRASLYEKNVKMKCPLCEHLPNPSPDCWMCDGTGKANTLLNQIEPPKDIGIECEICYCEGIAFLS